MSRQNKQRKKMAIAKQFSTIRKGGGHGPKTTTPSHGKKLTFNKLKRNVPTKAKPLSIIEAVMGLLIQACNIP